MHQPPDPASRASRKSHLTVLTSPSSVPHFPAEDAKLRATSLATRRGGNGGNSLEVLQQFAPASALALHLVATLPSRDSAATAKVLSSFGGEGRVDLSQCIHREDQTEAASCYVIRSEATGSRTIVNHNGLADMTAEEFRPVAEAFREKEADTWWHFEVCRHASEYSVPPQGGPPPRSTRLCADRGLGGGGRESGGENLVAKYRVNNKQGRVPETTLQCIQYLRRHLPQSRVSVEVEKPGRDGLRELASEADVVIYSRSWAEVSF